MFRMTVCSISQVIDLEYKKTRKYEVIVNNWSILSPTLVFYFFIFFIGNKTLIEKSEHHVPLH